MRDISVEIIVTLITVGGVIFTAVFKVVELVVKNYLDKKRNLVTKSIPKENPLQHPLFSKISYWIERKIYLLDFGDDDRDYIYRSIIAIKFIVVSDKTKEFVKNRSLDNVSKNEFSNEIFKMISDAVGTYNNLIRRDFENRFDKGYEIYEVTMNHPIKGFNHKHEPIMEFLEMMVTEVCESDIYCSNSEKLEIILDTLQAALGVTYSNLEQTYKGMNGSLEQLLSYGRK